MELRLRFPLEVVLRVVSHMNHYTVIGFLRAVGEYRQYAALITDHPHITVFFSDVNNVEPGDHHQLIGVYGFVYGEPFTPAIARAHPIKLFEIENDDDYPWSVHRQWFPKDFRFESSYRTEREKRLNTALNCTTFLYINAVSLKRHLFSKNVDPVLESLESNTGCKIHRGLHTFLPELLPLGVGGRRRDAWADNKRAWVLCNDLGDPFALNRYTAIRLENVAVVSDLELPELTDLVLVYDNGSVDVPVIQGLFAPYVRRFVVHYDKQAPIFRKMTKFGQSRFRWETKWGAKERKNQGTSEYYSPFGYSCNPLESHRFELCYMDCIGGYGGHASHDQLHQQPRKKRDMSLSFLKRFHILFLTGVPWSIMENMPNLANLNLLYLTLTEVAQAPFISENGPVIDVPQMLHLDLTIKADDVRVPKFNFPKISIISIHIKGLNPDLSEFWESEIDGFGVHYLSIFSDPDLYRRSICTGKPMLLASDGGWRRLARPGTRASRYHMCNVLHFGFPVPS